MPAYTVKADVVDITTDWPKATDAFWVDTNVWYWQTYSRASQRWPQNQPRPYQLQKYPNFLKRCLTNGASLHWSGLSLSELVHQIEKAEQEIAESSGAVPALTSLKDFRHDHPALRSGVVKEIGNVCADIASIASLIPVNLDQVMVDQALADLPNCALDGYDQLTLHALRGSGISQVLSDDGDFSTVAGITLFTSNRSVIQTAQAQGRLLPR